MSPIFFFNNRAIGQNIDGKRYNQQGVDGEYQLPDGRKLYTESKNWSRLTNASERAERLKGMKNQFRKHIREVISKGDHIERRKQGVRTVVAWKGEKVPRLHYELRGGFFNSNDGTSKVDILELFKKEILESTDQDVKLVRKVLENSGDFDLALSKFLRIDEYQELVKPFSS